jgi:hypothetical protein
MGSYDQGGYSLGNGYMDPGDGNAKNIRQMKDDFYSSNYIGNSSWWAQGAIDKRFKVGDQSLYNWSSGNNNQNAYRYFFNLIRRHINMICGFQRKNRKSTITIPLHEADDALADDFNTVMRWSEDRDGFQEYLSESFEGSCDTGMTLLFMSLDYTHDVISGDIISDAVSFNNFLIDQYFRKQDLSDCNGVWRRRWTSKEGAKQLLPGYAKEIDKMKPGGMKDGRFPVQAELQNLALSNLFTYDEFHYRTTRLATMIIDPKTGESVEWEQDIDDEADLMERTLAEQPWLQVKKMYVPTVKLCLSLGDKEVYDGPNLLGIDSYPCVPSICYYEPDITNYAWRCMGVIRNLRDPQFLYNMRKIIELEILQSQVNSGWIFPIDAVTDVKAFRQTGQGFLIPLKAGHLPEEIKRIEAAAIPQSLLELSQSLAEDITKISGVNEELLGSATDDKSGILSMLRQGAGLTTLQTIFDKLDYTQRLYGKIRLQAIRKNFSKGKVRNILGHEADPRFFSSHSQKYSIALEEGNYSATQRQTELQQLLHFKEIGMAIADKSIIRAAIITNKKQVLEDMEEQSQQQQQAQQAESMQKEKMDNAKIMQAFASSKVDMAREKDLLASTQERFAKIDEILAGAEHKRTAADLDIVRQMVELEDLDLANFRQNLEMAETIKMTQGSESKHPAFREMIAKSNIANQGSAQPEPQQALTG